MHLSTRMRKRGIEKVYAHVWQMEQMVRIALHTMAQIRLWCVILSFWGDTHDHSALAGRRECSFHNIFSVMTSTYIPSQTIAINFHIGRSVCLQNDLDRRRCVVFKQLQLLHCLPYSIRSLDFVHFISLFVRANERYLLCKHML